MAVDDIRVVGKVEIRRLDPADVERQLDALAGVLADCVAGGASIGYLDPFSYEDARNAFEAFAAEINPATPCTRTGGPAPRPCSTSRSSRSSVDCSYSSAIGRPMTSASRRSGSRAR